MPTMPGAGDVGLAKKKFPALKEVMAVRGRQVTGGDCDDPRVWSDNENVTKWEPRPHTEEQRGPLSIHPEVRIWLEETGCTCSCKAEVRARV